MAKKEKMSVLLLKQIPEVQGYDLDTRTALSFFWQHNFNQNLETMKTLMFKKEDGSLFNIPVIYLEKNQKALYLYREVRVNHENLKLIENVSLADKKINKVREIKFIPYYSNETDKLVITILNEFKEALPPQQQIELDNLIKTQLLQ